jgi:hypothetical protein
MTITAMSASGSPRRATRIRWPLAASCLAVAAAVIIPAGPASAAVCDGVSCNGLDPNQAGCAADAITPVPPVTDQGLTLELRYSPTCHANWARITPARFQLALHRLQRQRRQTRRKSPPELRFLPHQHGQRRREIVGVLRRLRVHQPRVTPESDSTI